MARLYTVLMPFDRERHHRRSIRLHDHDYRSPGAYFVTMVTVNRTCLFVDAALRSIVERSWLAIPLHFAHASLDVWVIMPNHIHGIVVTHEAPSSVHLRAGALGAIIGTFKSVTTRRINQARQTPGEPVWQRNYYERIVRNDGELNRIRGYIAANPTRWALDRENLERQGAHDEWTADEDRWFTVSPAGRPSS
jgi:putative transposase